jgi:hypothetical protein
MLASVQDLNEFQREFQRRPGRAARDEVPVHHDPFVDFRFVGEFRFEVGMARGVASVDEVVALKKNFLFYKIKK